jgi:leucyl-tRNA synthetase
VQIVIQVNGKVRDRIRLPAGSSDDTVRSLALASEKVAAAIGGASVQKTIVVPDRLVSVVTGRPS